MRDSKIMAEALRLNARVNCGVVEVVASSIFSGKWRVQINSIGGKFDYATIGVGHSAADAIKAAHEWLDERLLKPVLEEETVLAILSADRDRQYAKMPQMRKMLQDRDGY